MTPGTRILKEKQIHILHLSKRYLCDRYCPSPGLCDALHMAYSSYSSNAYYELKAYITRGLGSSLWLSGWLRKHRPDLPRTKKDMLRYRLQWIDWMIACLEEDLK